jgi:hypothetical protein
MRTEKRVRRLLAGIGIAMLLAVAAGTAVGKEPAGRVTTAVGDVTSDFGRPLAVRSSISEEEKIALEKDEGCSVLIDDDALVEMCEETAMVLETDPESGRRLVRIDAGEIRIIVEPRAADERIEVHTPAAIATILGTIVHFAVDPVTGDTTISSAENRVRVRSSDPNVSGSTVVSSLEQIRLKPGEAPPEEPRRLEPEEFAELGGCLIDFHALAGKLASDEFQLRTVDRIAAAEGVDTPWNPARPPVAPALNPADDIVEPSEICSPWDCGIGELEGRPPVRGLPTQQIN